MHLLPVALCVAARPAAAQIVRGTIRDSLAGSPIAGAIVAAYDSRGALLNRVLSDGSGRYAIPRDAAAAELRVLRLGYRPTSVRLVSPTGPDPLTINVGMVRVPMAMDTVISASVRCPTGESYRRGQALWAQARTGLLAVQVATLASSADIHLVRYQHDLLVPSRVTDTVVRTEFADTTPRSFVAARSVDQLERMGYLEARSGREHLLAPDIATLLDDSFTRLHCFELRGTRGAEKRELGLSFRPLENRTGIVDVTGTIWIDTAATVLTEMEFGYTQVRSAVQGVQPGGNVMFLSLPNGVTLIDRWMIGAPSIDLVPQGNFMSSTRTGRIGVFRTYREGGGAVRDLVWSDGTTWHAPPAILRVTVRGGPLAPASGAAVVIRGTESMYQADDGGTIDVDSLIPARYRIFASEARFHGTGFVQSDTPTVTVLRGDTTRVSVTLLDPERAARMACRGRLAGNRGALVTRVAFDPPDTIPLSPFQRSVTVSDGLFPLSDSRIVQLTAYSFILCDVPIEKDLLLRMQEDTLLAERNVRLARIARVDTLTLVLRPKR